MVDRFPSPFEVDEPPGAEGWQDLYGYSSVFSEDRREYEESVFWFQDGVHWPDALTPWEATFVEFAMVSLSQYNTRHLLVPPSNGIDYRILNGYAYLAPVPAPADEIELRARAFVERAGFYFRHWDELYDRWMVKIRELLMEMEAIRFVPLPQVEDLDEVVMSGRGTGSGYELMTGYHRVLDSALKLWNYHFEFLNLGYAAYLDLFGFCKSVWPSIPDLSIATMVAGVDVDLFRPDDELKRLARLAFDTGVDEAFFAADVATTTRLLEAGDEGRAWLASFEEVAEPWFNFSTGSGFSHSDKIWIEHTEIPFGFIRGYIATLRDGGDIARPVEAIRAERDRLVREYAELLATDEERRAFHAKVELARVVFPFVENHNFYVEHWAHSVLWRKMRQLGEVLVAAGFLAEPDDVFYFKRSEVPDVLWDAVAAWATPAPARGPRYWPREIERRKGIVAALRGWRPVPALGVPPRAVTEPFTVMLWGITSDSVAAWLGGQERSDGTVTGFAASPGVVEGLARVITSADQIGQVQDGEILVAPLTAPSWAPVFGRIGATVTDTGGMMSHAAIVCREYGLPAVTGTGVATTTFTTGQRLRVDGSTGTVTVLD